jgi:hypothetical protein
VGEGMTVLHASTREEAEKFIDSEPVIRRGLRKYEVKLWALREGTLTVKTRLS